MTGQFLSACKLEVYIENPSRDSHYILNVCLPVHVSVHICDTLLILHLSPLYNVPFFLKGRGKKKTVKKRQADRLGWGEYFSGVNIFPVVNIFQK